MAFVWQAILHAGGLSGLFGGAVNLGCSRLSAGFLDARRISQALLWNPWIEAREVCNCWPIQVRKAA